MHALSKFNSTTEHKLTLNFCLIHTFNSRLLNEYEGCVKNRFAGFVFKVLSAILIEKCNHYVNTVVSIVVANSTIFEISLPNNIEAIFYKLVQICVVN